MNRRHGQTSCDNCHSPKSDGENLHILHGQAVCFIKCYTPKFTRAVVEQPISDPPKAAISHALTETAVIYFVLIPHIRRKVVSDFSMIPFTATNFSHTHFWRKFNMLALSNFLFQLLYTTSINWIINYYFTTNPYLWASHNSRSSELRNEIC